MFPDVACCRRSVPETGGIPVLIGDPRCHRDRGPRSRTGRRRVGTRAHLARLHGAGNAGRRGRAGGGPPPGPPA